MKKPVKIFAVVLVCAVALTSLVACAPMPNTNYEKACKNLEDNGYAVSSIKAGDEGFEDVVGEYASMYGVEVKDVEAVLRASKGESEEDTEIIQMMWCKTDAAAKTAYDTLKKAMDEEKDVKDAIYGRSGKVVYLGTKAAINATK